MVHLQRATAKCTRALLCQMELRPCPESQCVATFIPCLSHLGILISNKPTAARASITPRLGGPHGLNSWVRPERRGATILPTDVTDCPAPIRVPLAWSPPLCSSRSVTQVRPMLVEMEKKVEVSSTCHTLAAVAYMKISEQVRTVEWSSRAGMLFP